MFFYSYHIIMFYSRGYRVFLMHENKVADYYDYLISRSVLLWV
jgi:hypothetical protein